MKINLDSDDISENTDPEELTGLSTVLQAFLDFVQKLQRKPDAVPEKPSPEPKNDLPDDPVGDVIIEGFKSSQRQAMIPRKKSGWMDINVPKSVDDRHI